MPAGSPPSRGAVMDIDFFAPDVAADPFPYYEKVRAAGRCVRNEAAGIWMVTGYDDTLAVLRDPARFSSTLMSDDTFGPWYEGAPTMLGTDPPEHTRLRSVVQRLFTHRATVQREPLVSRLVDELLARDGVSERLLSGEAVDVVAALAAPLPMLVTASLLGLPTRDQPLLSEWTDQMAVGSVAAAVAGTEPEGQETYARAVAAGHQLADYVREHLASRSQRQGQNVMSHLVAAADKGQVTDAEVTAACVLLLLAGGETTVKAIGNAIVLLARHPEERRRLHDDPTLLGLAVEEVLRYSGPSQFDPRLVVQDTRIGSSALHKGDVVWVFQPAANRDPERFPDPDRFDVARTPNPHVSFGYGIHLCLGAPFARLEMRIALRRLLELTPDFEVRQVDYGRGFFVRGPSTLQLVGTGKGR